MTTSLDTIITAQWAPFSSGEISRDVRVFIVWQQHRHHWRCNWPVSANDGWHAAVKCEMQCKQQFSSAAVVQLYRNHRLHIHSSGGIPRHRCCWAYDDRLVLQLIYPPPRPGVVTVLRVDSIGCSGHLRCHNQFMQISCSCDRVDKEEMGGYKQLWVAGDAVTRGDLVWLCWRETLYGLW